jgi:short-subunit dehydrogenase
MIRCLAATAEHVSHSVIPSSATQTNVFGLATVTRLFLPLLRAGVRAAAAAGVSGKKHRSGRIVLVGSVAGKVSGHMQGVYSATKHAVEAIADALRVEVAPQSIQVGMPMGDCGKLTCQHAPVYWCC